MRCANSTSSTTSMTPCTSHQPVENASLPCATRAWLTESRFEYTM